MQIAAINFVADDKKCALLRIIDEILKFSIILFTSCCRCSACFYLTQKVKATIDGWTHCTIRGEEHACVVWTVTVHNLLFTQLQTLCSVRRQKFSFQKVTIW
ncbi:hypothetical protein ACOSP7_012026 [Xanthoceras sorbifolium]